MGACDHMDLLLVRHGVTAWNQEKRYLGHTDLSILESEIVHLAVLKKEFVNETFDHIYTSDLVRCQETLAYLDLSSSVTVDRRLREMNFGDWEGKTYDDLKENRDYRDWIDNWQNHSTPNGESGKAFKTRIDSFTQDLFLGLKANHRLMSEKILIMTHGGVIRYLISRLSRDHHFWDVSIKHSHAVRLSLSWQEGEWVCNSLLEVPSQAREKE
ncbi:histidine phosphatase family protein [Alteribacter populi]|uniref:histidine phosphatase family protein n=1 Tax=Alteribacter populi TaxID=2011011 RepID=UPI000BBB1211|nr:histidine phosphatase family protein [Alteribacter populi]